VGFLEVRRRGKLSSCGETMGLDRMPQSLLAVYLILIAAALPVAGDHTSLFQIGDDAKHRTFRDPDTFRDITQPVLLVFR
jgi:hypothetical protein